MNKSITVAHDGVVYDGELMTIKSTRLGWEDHGILTAMLHCDGEGIGTGVGGYALDMPAPRGTTGDRKGTAYGLDHLMQIMRTVGVDRWEQLPGKTVVVLYPNSGSHWGMTAVGIAGLLSSRVLIFKEHSEAWHEEVPVKS